jgi:hypothetical protein
MWLLVCPSVDPYRRVDMGKQLRHYRFLFLPGLAHYHRYRGYIHIFQNTAKNSLEEKV